MSSLTEPRSALVLGGAGGIGAAVAERVSSRHHTIVTYLQHAERAEALVRRLGSQGREVTAVRADLTTEAGVLTAFDAAEAFSPLAEVVDCVGGWDYPRLADLTVEQLDHSIALNLRSAILVLREAARRVVDGGRVALISSVAASVAPPRQVSYVAAKAGLEGAARVAAKELAGRGVTVNVVRPGATDTQTLREGTSPRAIEAMSAANAMRRLGTPGEVADVVELLLSPQAGWITGQIIDATGGLL
jgi:3-oxoacyl-[acyl-carrier protein] reductase